jgi:hypothetical protein
MPYYQPLIIGIGLPGYQHHPYGYWGGMPYHTGYHGGYHHWPHGYPYHQHGWQQGYPYPHHGWQGQQY